MSLTKDASRQLQFRTRNDPKNQWISVIHRCLYVYDQVDLLAAYVMWSNYSKIIAMGKNIEIHGSILRPHLIIFQAHFVFIKL